MKSRTLVATKTSLELIKKTKLQTIFWIRFDDIREYLDRENVDIRQVRCLNCFFAYLRNRRVVPVFNSTYFVSMDGFVYAVSKSYYSAIYHLYRYSIDRAQWTIMHDEPTSVVRLYNIIRLTDEKDTDDEIMNFLYSTDQVLA